MKVVASIVFDNLLLSERMWLASLTYVLPLFNVGKIKGEKRDRVDAMALQPILVAC
jgi:hypothetical protein